MADGIELNLGSGGATLDTDEQSDGKHQQVGKLAFGPRAADSTLVEPGQPLPSELVAKAPKSAAPSAVGVAAGGNADLDSAQLSSGTTGELLAVEFGATVATKAELFTVSDGTPSSVLARGFAWPGRMVRLPLPSRQFVAVAHSAAAGFDGFRVRVTNLDPQQAADLYANIWWDER